MDTGKDIWILETRTHDGELVDREYLRTRGKAVERAMEHIGSEMPRSRRGRSQCLEECRKGLEKHGHASDYHEYSIEHEEFTE